MLQGLIDSTDLLNRQASISPATQNWIAILNGGVGFPVPHLAYFYIGLYGIRNKNS